MTVGQRRVWLALEAQKRRRERGIVPVVEPGVSITLAGSILNITLTGTFPGDLMSVLWNPDDPSPRDEVDDIPPSQSTYDLTGQPTGWYIIGKLNFSDGSLGLPMSNAVYYHR
jgi:hypothetical protein